MIAPSPTTFSALRLNHRLHSVILVVDALYDTHFSISDLHHTIPAYVALLHHAFTINAPNVSPSVQLSIPYLLTYLSLSSSPRLYSPSIHVFSRAVSFFPSYPYVPF